MRRLEVLLLLVLGCCAAAANGNAASGKTPRLSSEGRANIELAQMYLGQNNLLKAGERAEAALSTDSGAAEVHVVLALIHARKGEADKADREYKRALKIAPTNGVILNAHAVWLCERGQAAQADAEFNQALRDPGYREPFQTFANAGRCAHGASQWAKAESYLRRALALAPADRGILLLLADTELRQGTLLEAQAFIQRSDALGSDARTLELAARIEDAAGNQLNAARYRQRLHDEFPNYAPTGEGARTP